MTLSDGIRGYVAHKRATGLKYDSAEASLRAFVRCTGDVLLSAVTPHNVVNFLNQSASARVTWKQRYRLLAYFFEFWSDRGAIVPLEMPPPKPSVLKGFMPHIYSRHELRSLLRAASGIRERYRESTGPQTFRTLILFLYGTGASVGEVLALRLEDVDLKRGTVILRKNRYDRPRSIPICEDLRSAMLKYAKWRARRQGCSAVYFVKNDGYPLIKSSLTPTFRKLCQTASVRRIDGALPTMQELRPTFAVHRITSWMRTGADLNRMLPALAVYMGHVGLNSTQKYLLMAPERFRGELNKLTPVHRRGNWCKNKGLMGFLATLTNG